MCLQAYGGYDPKGERPAAPAPAAASYEAPAPVSCEASTAATAAAMVMTSAPAKKWQPYGGYAPKRDSTSVPAATAAAPDVSAQVSYTASAASNKPSLRFSCPRLIHPAIYFS